MCTRANRRFDPSPLCLVFLMALCWSLGCPAQAQSQTPPDAEVNPVPGQKTAVTGNDPDLSEKNVLLLHAYTYETASSLIMDPIFLKEFTDAGLGAFDLHFEFMDLTKRPDPAHRREFAKYLGRKFEKRPIDLIIVLHSTGLSFLVEEGKDLFPGVPVINVIADPDFLENEDFRTAHVHLMHSLRRPFVILPGVLNVDSTVKSILNLRPGTRSLVVISGSSPLDRRYEQSVRRSLQAWHGKLEVEFFSARPLEEVLKRVDTLTPKTAILFANFSVDPDGKAYSPPEVVRKISRAANAPVFGLFDTLLGNGGIVGGVMKNHGSEAVRAAGLALEILRGSLPAVPVTIMPTDFIPMFDWEQLNRWGMDENRLPPGSKVLNRPKTIWSDYKWIVIGGIALILMQTALVMGLLVERHRKKVTEASLQEKEKVLLQSQNELRELTGRLISAHEEERSRLAGELHDDMAQRLAILSINAGKLEQQLMNSPGPIKEKLNEMKNQTVKISEDVHNLARQLHPSILDDLGLVRAIESECAAFLKREGTNIIFSHDNISNIAEKDVSLTLYRIVQEGLRNISKHACANHISVSLKGFDQGILLSIQDDGIGFDLAEARVLPGLGLSSLRERVRLVHGELSIQSQPGEGTVISVKAPLNSKRTGE